MIPTDWLCRSRVRQSPVYQARLHHRTHVKTCFHCSKWLVAIRNTQKPSTGWNIQKVPTEESWAPTVLACSSTSCAYRLYEPSHQEPTIPKIRCSKSMCTYICMHVCMSQPTKPKQLPSLKLQHETSKTVLRNLSATNHQVRNPRRNCKKFKTYLKCLHCRWDDNCCQKPMKTWGFMIDQRF